MELEAETAALWASARQFFDKQDYAAAAVLLEQLVGEYAEIVEEFGGDGDDVFAPLDPLPPARSGGAGSLSSLPSSSPSSISLSAGAAAAPGGYMRLASSAAEDAKVGPGLAGGPPGLVRALSMLALCLLEGLGTRCDWRRARQLLRAGVALDEPYAQGWMALVLREGYSLADPARFVGRAEALAVAAARALRNDTSGEALYLSCRMFGHRSSILFDAERTMRLLSMAIRARFPLAHLVLPSAASPLVSGDLAQPAAFVAPRQRLDTLLTLLERRPAEALPHLLLLADETALPDAFLAVSRALLATGSFVAGLPWLEKALRAGLLAAARDTERWAADAHVPDPVRTYVEALRVEFRLSRAPYVALATHLFFRAASRGVGPFSPPVEQRLRSAALFEALLGTRPGPGRNSALFRTLASSRLYDRNVWSLVAGMYSSRHERVDLSPLPPLPPPPQRSERQQERGGADIAASDAPCNCCSVV